MKTEPTYTEKEVFELMCLAFEQGFKKHNVVEAGLESKQTEVECEWILRKYENTRKEMK